MANRPVREELLLTLLRLGRRTTHHPGKINDCRLWLRYCLFVHWQSYNYKFGDHIKHMPRKCYSQYQNQTDKWLDYLIGFGLVKADWSTAKAGKTLRLSIGPFYKLTAAGRKEALKLKKEDEGG